MGTLRCRSAMNLIGRSYQRSVEAFIYSQMNVHTQRQISYIIIYTIATHAMCPVSIYNFDSLLTHAILIHICRLSIGNIGIL